MSTNTLGAPEVRRKSERPTAPPEPRERPAWVRPSAWPAVKAELARWGAKAATAAALAAGASGCTWHVHQPPLQPAPAPAAYYEGAEPNYYAIGYEPRGYRQPRRYHEPRRTVCRTTHRIGKGVLSVDVKRCREVRP